MPELPEVEVVAEGLRRKVVGKTIQKTLQSAQKQRFTLSPAEALALEKRRILKVERRAKYILIHLSGGQVLLLHLGMSGRLRTEPKLTLGLHDHLGLEFTDGTAMIFCDPRRFGMAILLSEQHLESHQLLKPLGVEPLEKGLTAAYLARRWGGKRQPVKVALMDQHVLVGVGNIYASEALFASNLSPFREAKTLSSRELTSLIAAIRKVLKAAIRSGGSSLRDYRHLSGEEGEFQHHFSVYGKKSEPCERCRGTVRKAVQAGRASYYCDSCQV